MSVIKSPFPIALSIKYRTSEGHTTIVIVCPFDGTALVCFAVEEGTYSHKSNARTSISRDSLSRKKKKMAASRDFIAENCRGEICLLSRAQIALKDEIAVVLLMRSAMHSQCQCQK